MAWIGCHLWLEWAWIWQNILMGFKKNWLGQIWAQAAKRACRAPQGRSGLQKKKTQLIIGPDPDRRSWPVGQVRVCKNLIWTRPVAIPNYYCPKYSKATLITRWSETAQQNYFRPSTSSTCLNQHLHWMLRLKQQVNLFALNR